jgi:fucose permease
MIDTKESHQSHTTQLHPSSNGDPLDSKLMTAFATNGDDVSLRRLRRKADWRISPLTFLCYLMNLIDKVAYNYAGAMGMKEDLQLTGNEFSNVATAFFVAYLVAELPMGEQR